MHISAPWGIAIDAGELLCCCTSTPAKCVLWLIVAVGGEFVSVVLMAAQARYAAVPVAGEIGQPFLVELSDQNIHWMVAGALWLAGAAL